MQENEKEKKPIERQSSIESEPRTLDSQQIQFAREAALHVMKSKNMEEALLVFTKGLKPVSTSWVISRQKSGEVWKQRKKCVAAAAEEEEEEEEDEEEDDERLRRIPPCIREEPSRDVVTSPF